MVKTTQALALAMKTAAMEAYPNEGCGLIVSVGRKVALVVCKNVSPTPNLHFMIDQAEYMRIRNESPVLAIWHSHVTGSNLPSDADRVGCEATSLPWLITAASLYDGHVIATDSSVLEPSGYKMDYIERPYVLGVIDCYSLVADYYQREYGIRMNNYPRLSPAGAVNYSMFVDVAKAEGFIQQFDQEPQVGDVFLIQMGADIPNHLALYIGGDMILHHMKDRLSRRDIYGGYWLKHTTHHYRHQKNAH